MTRNQVIPSAIRNLILFLIEYDQLFKGIAV